MKNCPLCKLPNIKYKYKITFKQKKEPTFPNGSKIIFKIEYRKQDFFAIGHRIFTIWKVPQTYSWNKEVINYQQKYHKENAKHNSLCTIHSDIIFGTNNNKK